MDTVGGQKVIFCYDQDHQPVDEKGNKQLIKDGPLVRYYQTGEIETKANYENDVLAGDFEEFHKNGKLKRSGEYEGGKVTGTWKRFYENGNLQDKGDWDKEKPHGDWEFFFEDGKIKSQGKFAYGKKICTWKDYDPQGDVKKTDHGGEGCAPSPIKRIRAKLLSYKNEITGNDEGSGQSISWSPEVWRISDEWAFYGHLGGISFSSTTAQKDFLILSISGSIIYSPSFLKIFGLELEAGSQRWDQGIGRVSFGSFGGYVENVFFFQNFIHRFWVQVGGVTVNDVKLDTATLAIEFYW